ncbi:hypothetical protein BJ875DRAFT_489885 [Amylocarpus encephaloides]|uniref:Uncharacterized protein n=1 Tax=Amylocarpus encephaloides TaxID=45428 RepID=A0A9P8BZI0_9HELO|nr:hypothetical protein BJ875DRAFT_489885 [Amylocarpus encephaloides]
MVQEAMLHDCIYGFYRHQSLWGKKSIGESSPEMTKLVWDKKIQHIDHLRNNQVAAILYSLDADILVEVQLHGMSTTDILPVDVTDVFYHNRHLSELLKPIDPQEASYTTSHHAHSTWRQHFYKARSHILLFGLAKTGSLTRVMYGHRSWNSPGTSCYLNIVNTPLEKVTTKAKKSLRKFLQQTQLPQVQTVFTVQYEEPWNRRKDDSRDRIEKIIKLCKIGDLGNFFDVAISTPGYEPFIHLALKNTLGVLVFPHFEADVTKFGSLTDTIMDEPMWMNYKQTADETWKGAHGEDD